jgi:SAM-dependent methyltransferase
MSPEEQNFYRTLVDSVARGYRGAGRAAYHFARGKLRHDPVFAAILSRGFLSRRARVADLGCGQALLLTILLEARTRYEQGQWPVHWAPPPQLEVLTGIDLSPNAVRAGKIALGERASMRLGDVRTAELPSADAIVMVDVLHYLEAREQEAVLARARRVLSPGGVLLIRVGDAEAKLRFAITKVTDQVATAFRTGAWPRMHCRPLLDWRRLLERFDLQVRAEPMSAGTPYSNVLLIATAPP